MAALNVGLIGCGGIARQVHIEVLTRLPNVELVALAEPDPQRRDWASRRAPTSLAFTGYEELLQVPNLDAVVICLPNALHAEATVAALQRGKHVYLEKPLATSLDEARCVLAAWRRAGVVGMIGFNFRSSWLYQTARRHLQANTLGELVGARSIFSTPARPLPAWKQTRRSGGGVLLDLASHHVDLVSYVFGQDVRAVFASLRSQRSEGDSAVLQLWLADGLPVQSLYSLNAVDEDRIEIYGLAGKLAVSRYPSLGVEITRPTDDFRLVHVKRLWRGVQSLRHSPRWLSKLRAPGHEPSYGTALARFVAAARAHQPASPDFEDGYRSLAVVEAAEESARTGRIVSVADFADAAYPR